MKLLFLSLLGLAAGVANGKKTECINGARYQEISVIMDGCITPLMAYKIYCHNFMQRLRVEGRLTSCNCTFGLLQAPASQRSVL